MKDVQKPDHVSLTTLVNRLREGRFVVPDFQREFEWKPWDINALMRSIFLDYFIGSLLLWKGKAENFQSLACEPIYGFQGQAHPEFIVLDGQQRLTAMYYAFMAPHVPAPDRANRFLYFIRVDRFMEESYDDAFYYDWTKTSQDLLPDLEQQFESHLFPLAVIGQGGWALPNWVQGYERHWREKRDAALADADQEAAALADRRLTDAKAFGEHLRALTEQYQIAYIELDQDLEIDKVCDIFTQINSRGVRLDVFDLINALLKPRGLKLKKLWREASQRLDFVDTERMNVYLLQVMSILRQAYCSPKYLYYLLPGQKKNVREPDGSLRTDILIQDVEEFEQRWHQSVRAVEAALNVLRHPQEFGAISPNFLPYVSILPAFAALRVALDDLPPTRRLDAQRKLRHWYWASVFMNRYSGAVESTSTRDYLDVKAWFEDDDAEPSLISEFRTRFRTIDLRRETKRGTSVYNGIFNLLVLQGARDWMTGTVPQHGDLDDHHIVPKAWGKDHVLSTSIDSILNRTPLTAETNRNVIGERLPNCYLPELIKASGETAVRATLESHFVSAAGLEILLRDPFHENDYEDFVSERQRTLIDGIENLLIKARLDLSPQLRELDSRVEKVELMLRQRIEKALGGDMSLLPSQVSEKAQGRRQAALRKALDLESSGRESLANLLEYCDLRELQDCIMNKSLWTHFEAEFTNKETLGKRFDQLSELRNAIRHSRKVTEIVEKEGEVAVLWFEQLARQ